MVTVMAMRLHTKPKNWSSVTVYWYNMNILFTMIKELEEKLRSSQYNLCVEERPYSKGRGSVTS